MKAMKKNSKKIKIFRFGFDVHGVIDAAPDQFRFIMQSLIDCGAEVHVVTGKSKRFVGPELKAMNIPYTHLFSIIDSHEELGTPMDCHDEFNCWIDEELWDKTKAEYCKQNEIDIHFDDSETYGPHFYTPYAKMKIS